MKDNIIGGIIVLLVVLLLIAGICSFVLLTQQSAAIHQNNYLQYITYVEVNTGRLYVYDHGRFEPLLGADGEVIVVPTE